MEIVSEPDLRSTPRRLASYLRKLRAILRYLGTCDGNMEEGSHARRRQRLGAPAGRAELGTRAEIKNVNSVRFMPRRPSSMRAERQIELLEGGGMRWCRRPACSMPKTGTTRPMRSKEEAHDYRYFPDPDLLPLEFDAGQWVDEIRRQPAGAARREEGSG